jgi:hypothetical protein
MTYFADLSEYAYGDLEFARPGTKNIGWLASGRDFPTAQPSDELLELLWCFCSISVAKARGGHDCEFCPKGTAYFFGRSGRRLALSTAQIRVFGDNGTVYAAPNLIYHYVLTHHYRPPDEFIEALRNGPRPPNQDYFERLERLGLKWSSTSTGEGARRLS